MSNLSLQVLNTDDKISRAWVRALLMGNNGKIEIQKRAELENKI